MASGGKRSAAGRPPGVRNKKTAQQLDAILKTGLTPLEYLLALLRNEAEDADKRFEAAKAAAPFVHPRLAAIEHSGELRTSYVVEVPATVATAEEWSKQYAPTRRLDG